MGVSHVPFCGSAYSCPRPLAMAVFGPFVSFDRWCARGVQVRTAPRHGGSNPSSVLSDPCRFLSPEVHAYVHDCLESCPHECQWHRGGLKIPVPKSGPSPRRWPASCWPTPIPIAMCPMRASKVSRAPSEPGRWRMNGERIILRRKHRLLDGRHRLLAWHRRGSAHYHARGRAGVDPSCVPDGGSKVANDLAAMCWQSRGIPRPGRSPAPTGEAFTGSGDAGISDVGILDYALDAIISPNIRRCSRRSRGRCARLVASGIGNMLHYQMQARDGDTAS